EKGKAIVTLTPHTGSVEWHSSLAEAPSLTLTAAAGAPWTEAWTLVVSPIWHVDVSGLAPILLPATEGRPREFHPYPGEKLSLAITRPAAVPGQSLTVQSSHLVITPGARSLDAALELALSSSRGAPFTVTLPDGATVQSLALDRVEQPLRQEGRKATITVPPGEHRLTFTWREPTGLSILFHTPRPELGLATVNASVEVRLPTSRWTLLLGGPHLGPAVLFWSFLVAMLLAAFALSRVPNVPVTTLQWFLLAIGLSQVEIVPAAIVAAWLIALGLRRAHGQTIAGRAAFNLTQLVLVGLTIASALILFESIHRGLLGAPDMQIEGNGSDASRLRWFSDRTPQLLPGAWVLSVPLIVYKLAMLVWALWLASSLLRWLPWAWGGFSEGGLWRKAPPRAEKTAGSAAPPAPSPGASPPAAPATAPIEAKPAD
ncbi:MAG: hypothetical protein JST92_15165, partial [Deltaproteobacteria bacterium]|nr:hypothetical protein [Deltaproteobacteria bacterium]